MLLAKTFYFFCNACFLSVMILPQGAPTHWLLPQEILQHILSDFCDQRTLENLWFAISCNHRISSRFWHLLNQVIDKRIARQTQSEDFCKIADSLLRGSVRRNRDQVLHQRLNVLTYCEQSLGILWCGYLEFKDPLLPDWSAQTAKVVLQCDEDRWNWAHAVGWNHSFTHTIKLVSQMYNFVPVTPRGQIFGVTVEDRAIIHEVSRQLQARDQVMTLRFGNMDGFILRVISPLQAHQRLAKFKGSSIAHFQTSSNALVCSWECPQLFEQSGDMVSLADRQEAISRIVRALNGII